MRLSIAVPLLLLAPLALAADGFFNSCRSCGLDGTALTCTCTTNGKDQATTKLDLNKCLELDASQDIVYQSNGNFGNSCSNLSLSGSRLTADCVGSSKSIDLDTVIGNDNGFLVCDGHSGCCLTGTCSTNIGCF